MPKKMPAPAGLLLRVGDTGLRQSTHVRCVAMSFKGDVVLTGDQHGTVRCIDTVAGTVLFECARPFPQDRRASRADVDHVAFSHDDSRFAVRYSGVHGRIAVFNAKTGSLAFLTDADTYHAVSLSADGALLGAGRLFGIDVFKVTSGQLLHSFSGDSSLHETVVGGIAFSPDASKIAGIFFETETETYRRLSVFDVYRKERLEVHDCNERMHTPKLVWTSDGRRIVYDDSCVIETLSPREGAWHRVSLPHSADHEERRLVPLPSMSALAFVGGADGTAELVELPSGIKHPLPVTTRCIAVSGDGSVFVTAEGVSLRVWNAISRQEKGVAPQISGDVTVIGYSLDRSRLYTGDRLGLRTWSLPMGVSLGAMDCGQVWSLNAARSLACVGTGRQASASLLEVTTGRVLGGASQFGVLSPDGSMVASLSRGETPHTVLLHAAIDGALLRECSEHRARVYGVAFSCDSALLVSCCWNGDVIARSTADGTLAWRFRAARPTMAVALSADGTRAVVGCNDRVPRLYDVTSGKLIHEFRGHVSSPVTVLAWSMRGDLLATSDEKSVRVWSVATGEQLGLLRERACSLAFSPDGSQLAVGCTGSAAILNISALARK